MQHLIVYPSIGPVSDVFKAKLRHLDHLEKQIYLEVLVEHLITGFLCRIKNVSDME